MTRKNSRRLPLRLKKNTLRTLSATDTARVQGGHGPNRHPVNINASRYCLDTELP